MGNIDQTRDYTAADLSKWSITDLRNAIVGEWEMYSEQGLTRMTRDDFEYLADLRALTDAYHAAVEYMPGFDVEEPLSMLVDWFTGKGYAASPFEIRDHFADPDEEIPNLIAGIVSTYDEADEADEEDGS